MATRASLVVTAEGFRLGDDMWRLLGGAIHYFRVPRPYWRDRLTKLVDLGCNTVETYVAWNAHEPKKGRFDFEGMLDVVAFAQLADELGLHVIVRPGPYICAEWDLGGLPNWLLAEPDLSIRCSDPAYLAHVDDFFDELVPMLAPLQTTHGGPIIAVQIENEYGYFGNDRDYLTHLRDGLLSRGIDVPLFTSDGTYQKLCVAKGGLDEHLRTANFGSDAAERFRVLREVQPTGPLACMEFWVGWFDSWGDPEHHTRPAEETAAELDAILREDASVNFYMFHGGTNWGFHAGGNLHERFLPFVTSYDYDALLTEWGDTTPKYDACRAVVHRALQRPMAPITPARADRRDLGVVELTRTATLDDALPALSTPIEHPTTRSFERLGARSDRFDGNGFVLYRTTLSSLYRGETLLLRGLHDWAHVLLDGRSLATVFRDDEHPRITLEFAGETATLDVLVAHLARSNFGHRMSETKGLAGVVVTSGQSVNDQRDLFGWTHYPLSFDEGLARVPWIDGSDIGESGIDESGAASADPRIAGPALHRGTFTVESPADTFLYPEGFQFGCAILNGFNLGRYWQVGPQRALYVPGPMLRRGENDLVLFEAAAGTADHVTLRAEPSLNG